ncbi:hypothetical protein [Paraburkholderia sediminicola]|uniref:hypothetical protein n=1 Tax=Paraburkholderia sediminicola TaxID=458836 RepID=UPI0038BADA81
MTDFTSRPADAANPPDHLVNQSSLKNYVRAILGMSVADLQIDSQVDPVLGWYLDELSKNTSTLFAQPVTRDSFILLCVLYTAREFPELRENQALDRSSFMTWLNSQLYPAGIRNECIPKTYFDMVRATNLGYTTEVMYQHHGLEGVAIRNSAFDDLRYVVEKRLRGHKI